MRNIAWNIYHKSFFTSIYNNTEECDFIAQNNETSRAKITQAAVYQYI